MQRLPDDGSVPTSRADLAESTAREGIDWRQEMQTIKHEILSRMDRRFVALLIAVVVTNVGTERYL